MIKDKRSLTFVRDDRDMCSGRQGDYVLMLVIALGQAGQPTSAQATQ